ncbi:MAG: hypothetical protein GY714_01720 [Desulfobacterales bacterium]|nr:hypothetical protein [Desulfobacterales bacterium]
MEFIETQGKRVKKTNNNKVKYDEILPSKELLKKLPVDPRAWHCKTVEEYYLWKFSSDYSGLNSDDTNFSEDLHHDVDGTYF